MAHAQQRSAGIAECNRWNSKAFALQNANSHPTPAMRQLAGVTMTMRDLDRWKRIRSVRADI
jgi:hypothetical protein